MQVTETLVDGLKRELKVVVPASELHSRAEEKFEDIKTRVRLNGFRPGKVPIQHVKQMFGKNVMAEVLEQAVNETSMKAIEGRGERVAQQPSIALPEDKEAVEGMIEGARDLEYTMSFEVLPKIELADLRDVSLEKEVAEPSDQDVEDAIKRLLKSHVSYQPKDGAAEQGDRLLIDYRGAIGGEYFEGGSGEDAYVVLGDGRFIPGFEEGLTGAKTGEVRKLTVTFPEDYQAEDLAGKEAEFEVAVKEVAVPVEPKPDHEFAMSLGLESFDKLKDAVRASLQKELDAASRGKLKKALLDILDERHSFEIPPSLVQSEFDGIWKNVTGQLERAKRSFEDEGTTEEKAREEYGKIAARRVRLGLVLSEIGNNNEIRISDDELRRAILERARQFPGQEKQVVEFYRRNPNAMNELRAPIYEDKVIDFALELAKIDEKKVTPAELFQFVAEQEREQAALMGDGGHDHEHDHAHDHECGPDCDHDHDHDHHHHHDHGHARGGA